MMFCATFPMVMRFVTDDAALHVPSPACDAITLHVPAPTTLRAVPDTVQTADGEDLNDTASPDEDVAARVNGD